MIITPIIGRVVLDSVSKPLLFVSENELAAADCFPVGSQAYSTAIAALAPRASWRFFDQGMAGDAKAMNRTLKREIEPITAVRNPGGISGPKAALEALGRAGGPVRPPGSQLVSEDRNRIVEILRRHPETRDQVR